MDDYYKDLKFQQKDEKGIYNFDLPQSMSVEQLLFDLKKLSEGQTVHRLEYTFNHPEKIPSTRIFEPAKVVIVEGLFVLHFDELNSLADFRIFIESAKDKRFERRKYRDTMERGIPYETFIHQWSKHVEPAYQQFLEPYIPNADLIIDNNVHLDIGLNQVSEYIRKIISKTS